MKVNSVISRINKNNGKERLSCKLFSYKSLDTSFSLEELRSDLKKAKIASIEKRKEKQRKVEYNLSIYNRSNQDTCLLHRPSVTEGQWVESGDLLADCASSSGGELALGQNLLIAYMPWEGYNFEDAILISERLVYDDLYTSIHIEKYEMETKETKLGFEEITRNIPDITENQIAHLDSNGIALVGSWVEEGDILVGKITPINKKAQSPYQKLLYTILEKEFLPVRDSSLRAPKGISAKVIKVRVFPSENTLNNINKSLKGVKPSLGLYSAEKTKKVFGRSSIMNKRKTLVNMSNEFPLSKNGKFLNKYFSSKLPTVALGNAEVIKKNQNYLSPLSVLRYLTKGTFNNINSVFSDENFSLSGAVKTKTTTFINKTSERKNEEKEINTLDDYSPIFIKSTYRLKDQTPYSYNAMSKEENKTYQGLGSAQPLQKWGTPLLGKQTGYTKREESTKKRNTQTGYGDTFLFSAEEGTRKEKRINFFFRLVEKLETNLNRNQNVFFVNTKELYTAALKNTRINKETQSENIAVTEVSKKSIFDVWANTNLTKVETNKMVEIQNSPSENKNISLRKISFPREILEKNQTRGKVLPNVKKSVERVNKAQGPLFLSPILNNNSSLTQRDVVKSLQSVYRKNILDLKEKNSVFQRLLFFILSQKKQRKYMVPLHKPKKVKGNNQTLRLKFLKTNSRLVDPNLFKKMKNFVLPKGLPQVLFSSFNKKSTVFANNSFSQISVSTLSSLKNKQQSKDGHVAKTPVNPLLKNKTFGKTTVSVQLYLAIKRKVQVGDKLAGRHGNKGIISRILPREDMPFLPDGTPIDMVLNPLGVPSRMNVGQIYECLLGLAGKYLGENYKVFPFDEIYGPEASRSFVYSKLYSASQQTGLKWLFNPNTPGKIRLYDGRTGDCFDQAVTVGQAYILRLVHMVDDKIHARSTGPYSLVTQQPLRGRSKQGGQRLGEMEVWALEGYGAAFTLLEMLTIKSDDMTGRMTLWSNLILNKEISIGTPESFKVLVCELRALCLDIGLFRITKNNPLQDLVEIENLMNLQ